MWRFFRKRRAMKAYRTKLLHHLRDTYGRKLYYSTEEVQRSVRDIGANVDYVCYALGMFCDREAFEAYHALSGEACDYEAMRAEVFAHVAHIVPSPSTAHLFDHGCGQGEHHGHGHGHHHHTGHHDGGGWDGGGHHGGGHHGGGDFGGGDFGGGDFGGGDFGGGGGGHHH